MTMEERLIQRQAELENAKEMLDAEMGKHQSAINNLTALHQAENQRHQNAVNVLVNSMKHLEGRVAELKDQLEAN